MTAVSTSDIIGAVGGVIGAIGGIGGPVVALIARRDSRQSAQEAAKVSQIDADRQHDELRPEAPAEIVAGLRDGALFGSILVQRDYHVVAEGYYSTDAKHQLALPLLLRAKQQQPFHIEDWFPDSTTPKTKEIVFKFWPPAAGSDSASPWACRCERPSGDDIGGPGHWEWRVPVVYRDLSNNIH